MYGYKIKIKGLPTPLFACSTTLDNYEWINHNDQFTLEISVHQSQEYSATIDTRPYRFLDTACLSCIAGAENRTASCKPGTKIEITTVAVCFDELEATACELTVSDTTDHSCFLFPAFSVELRQTQEISCLLNKYIKHNTSDESYNKALCISDWFNLAACIDKHTRQQLITQRATPENYYAKKIDYIIKFRYNQKLSLTEIAKEFGVSMSYLSSSYSLSTGKRFKDALLAVRLEKAKELILSTSLSAAQIADAVGFYDDTYLRKCFKKLYGVNISDYKNINKGMTLYHEKPNRK